MVHGSWLTDHASRLVAQGQQKIGARARCHGDPAPSFLGLEPRALGMSHEPWAMSHEPLTINSRLINEFFDYLLCVSAIRHYPQHTDSHPCTRHRFTKIDNLRTQCVKEVGVLGACSQARVLGVPVAFWGAWQEGQWQRSRVGKPNRDILTAAFGAHA